MEAVIRLRDESRRMKCAWVRQLLVYVPLDRRVKPPDEEEWKSYDISSNSACS